LFFEPLFSVKSQSMMWSSGFVVLAIGIAICSLLMMRSREAYESNCDANEFLGTKPSTADRLT